VVHSREAWNDTLAVLQTEGVPERTVFHCFTGGPAEARRCLDLGAYLSFSGIVTFKGASDVRDAAALCPADRLMVETDSPFLAPVPHRGKPNEPAFVSLVGAAVAGARGETPGDVAASTWAVTAAVFGLPLDAP
jgi:TatD DNase family protein